MKKIFYILIIFNFLISEEQNNFSFSIGALNERTGQTLVNFAYNLYTKDNFEVFVSIGNVVPIIPLYAGGFGFKKYFIIPKQEKVSPFISLSAFRRLKNTLTHPNNNEEDCLYFSSGISVFIAPIRSMDVKTYFQIGVSLLNDFDDGSDELGFLNFEFRF